MKPLTIHRYSLHTDRRGKIHRRCARGPACGVRGCKQIGSPCWLPDDADQPSEY